MAVTKIGITTGGNIMMFQGLSTDDKPDTCGSGSTFYELNTEKTWVYDANNENAETSDGWWDTEPTVE